MSALTLAPGQALADLAGPIAARALRTDFTAPGFALVDRGTAPGPRAFRAELVALAEALVAHYSAHFGGLLRFVTLGTFDQQAPTRPHRDGGPDASLLVLGYEPSLVPSRLFLLDYSRCAFERGQSPKELLDCCNPAFGPGAELLLPYTTEVSAFAPGRYQVLVVNNSALPWQERATGMLGVLHHAVIDPRPGARRVINSLQLGLAEVGMEEADMGAFVDGG